MRSLLFVTLAVCLVASTLGAYTQSDVNKNDINTLQYALSLEYIEAFFYTKGQATYNGAAFVAAGFNASDYDYFTMIMNHEVAHVGFLQTAIRGLGATPVTACGNYNFTALGADPFASVANYIAIAAGIEPVGTGAYVYASTFITNKDYLTAAATILTVEARHTQYVLNLRDRGLSNPSTNFPTINPGYDVSTVGGIINPLNSTCILSQLSTNLTSLPVNTLASNQAYTQYSASSVNASNPVSQDTLNANDAALLNYALYLEYLEAAFYAYFVGTASTPGLYSAANFTAAGFSSSVFTYLQLISAHEAAHVSAIQSTLGAGNFISQCQYNFSSIAAGGIAAFVSTAAYTLEPTGVSAYDGAVSAATSRTLLQTAAGIAATEARHASILAVLANQTAASSKPISPFPNTRDTPLAPSVVRQAVLGLGILTEVAGCTPAIFPPNVYYQYSNYTAPTSTSSTSTTAGLTSSTTGKGPVNVAISLSSVFAFALMIVFAVVLYL